MAAATSAGTTFRASAGWGIRPLRGMAHHRLQAGRLSEQGSEETRTPRLLNATRPPSAGRRVEVSPGPHATIPDGRSSWRPGSALDSDQSPQETTWGSVPCRAGAAAVAFAHD